MPGARIFQEHRVVVRSNLKFKAYEPRKAVVDLIAAYELNEDLAAKAAKRKISQREFLLAAMYLCDFTRADMAKRMGAKKKALDKWLASPDAADYNGLSPVYWKFIAEIVRGTSPSFRKYSP